MLLSHLEKQRDSLTREFYNAVRRLSEAEKELQKRRAFEAEVMPKIQRILKSIDSIGTETKDAEDIATAIEGMAKKQN